MAKKNEKVGCTPFIIVVVIVTGIWNFILRRAYYGQLEYMLLLGYSIVRVINALVHNIHYEKFRTIYNPFFVCLLYGGFIVAGRILTRITGCIIPTMVGPYWIFYAIDFVDDINEFIFFAKYIPGFILSMSTYVVLFLNIRKARRT